MRGDQHATWQRRVLLQRVGNTKLPIRTVGAAPLCGEELNFALADRVEPSVVLGGGSVYGIDVEQGRAGLGFWLTAESRGHGVALRLCARGRAALTHAVQGRRRDTVMFSLLPDELR
jgi:hypothetical protein